jgi:hypothetical protein
VKVQRPSGRLRTGIRKLERGRITTLHVVLYTGTVVVIVAVVAVLKAGDGGDDRGARMSDDAAFLSID